MINTRETLVFLIRPQSDQDNEEVMKYYMFVVNQIKSLRNGPKQTKGKGIVLWRRHEQHGGTRGDRSYNSLWLKSFLHVFGTRSS